MKNTIYNNIINNTLERDKAAQGNDSLETARAVFNNMGVALPGGDMGEVYETLKTNDYMGWRACTAEEAQAAADRGTAAMGVSEDGIVIIAANDEDEPVAATASIMTLSNDATVSPASEMEYYAYSYGTTSGGSTSGELEAAYIRADGIYNKVEFFHSDKVWKCVNEDLIYNMSASNTVKARSTYNIWDGDPPNASIKTYNDNQLRLFYCIDPYGVARYIKVYTDHVYSGEQLIVQAKDRFFNALFNRSPYHFAYDSDVDEFYITTNTSNIDSYVSESELLFGMHNPNDFPVSMSVLDIVSRVANLLFDTNYFEIKTTERIWHTYSCVMAMGLTAVKNELRSYVVGNSYLEDALAKYGRTDLTWANNFIRYTDADALAYDYSKNPNYTNKIVGHCADMPQFSVFIDLGEDNEWNLSDVRRLIDVYSSSEEDDDGTSSEFATKLAQLKAKFPHGKYWNHVIGSVNDDDSEDCVTNYPCTTHRSADSNNNDGNEYKCNYCDDAKQCVGFAKKCAKFMTGIQYSDWDFDYNAIVDENNKKKIIGYSNNKSFVDEVLVGDIVIYGSDYDHVHAIYVTSVNGDDVYYGECNGAGDLYPCKIEWNQRTSITNLKSNTYVRVQYSPENPAR